MLKPSLNGLVIKEYADQKDLALKADKLLKDLSAVVEKELGSEVDGVTFMPVLNVICKLQNDPTTNVDPVSYSVVKRPNSMDQISHVVHNILLKDPLFLSSIMHGLAEHLSEMMSIHFDMSSLVNSMGASFNEENEVETDQNTGKNSESSDETNDQGSKKNSNEVN